MATEEETPSDRRLELRKYPNRRYYDTTHSRYVTIEDILAAIRDGFEVHATDSRSGEDITAKVLAQIILEHDSPKLEIFPVALLHQLIRANDSLVRDFVDKYFCRALSAFLDSQRQFDHYLRQALRLPVSLPNAQDWARWTMAPFMQPFLPAEEREEHKPGSSEAAADSGKEAELRRQVEELRKEVDSLRQQLK